MTPVKLVLVTVFLGGCFAVCVIKESRDFWYFVTQQLQWSG